MLAGRDGGKRRQQAVETPIERPVTMASAPPSRAWSLASSSGRSGTTTTDSGVGAISSSVPSRSRNSAFDRSRSGGVILPLLRQLKTLQGGRGCDHNTPRMRAVPGERPRLARSRLTLADDRGS